MNGDQSQHIKLINECNPSTLLHEMMDLVEDFNTPRQYMIQYINHMWLNKVKFPMLRYRLDGIVKKTAEGLYDNPNYLIFFLIRYINYAIEYCKMFELTLDELFDIIFDPSTISLSINYDRSFNSGETPQAESFNLIVRAILPIHFIYHEDDLFAITSVDANVRNLRFEINQKCYNCKKLSDIKTSKMIYDKTLILDSNGELVNPNYSISKSLLDEDMEYYKTMIGQLLIFMGGLMESTLKIAEVPVDSVDKTA